MSIDFGVLIASPGLMAAIVAGFLLLKCLVIYGLATQMGLPFQDRPVFTLLLAQGGEFAFVVFQAAAGARLFDAQTASLLIGAVAVSMLVSPLLLVATDKWLLRRFAKRQSTVQLEEISEQRQAPVLIAGFGRYGQIVARMMLAEGVECTVLEHDAEMVEAARSFGYQVFYGDASRLDLLRTAGAATGTVLLVAVDDVEQSLKIVDLAQAHFPNLQIVARARDVTHWNQLRERNVMLVQREMFESSLRSGRSVLELLGRSPEDADVTARRFRTHNLELFEQMHPYYKDRAKMIAAVKQGRQQLEAQMARERLERTRRKAQEPSDRQPESDQAIEDGDHAGSGSTPAQATQPTPT